MSQPMKGVSAEDFMQYKTLKGQGGFFCADCGQELGENDPTPFCLQCDHVYQEYQENLVENHI